MKKYLFLLLLLFIPVYFTSIKRTKGFSYKKIHSRYAYDSRWDFGPPNEKQRALLEKITKEPFTLLGSGKECYAFMSADGETVIKFFKQKHMKTRYLLNYLPLSKEIKMVRSEMLNRHRAFRNKLYQSYQIAYQKLPEETGVLYLHLTKTKHLKLPIRLEYGNGKRVTLKLDDMEFLVQKRATPILDYLRAHPKKGKEAINAILTLLHTRRGKGVGDNDIDCRKNLGFLDDRAIQIDIGEFFPALPALPNKEDLRLATLDLRAFLEETSPSLVTYLDDQITLLSKR
ncbi:hypothetical protein [Candidatus Neptunochlamydia vexilliferae]|uniref:Uncharacterized protein n=1 Tax=Candidatus Neptunichlamydia vexilliferae TaxID=1651774 RepID=A0ABS0AZ95_9BACT|nr:hypothetical protein [Candidatus Neptunochlamydia vexilliferae]MBF5059458.1 hypothetical protein [Candidatus Neptunochlamydia vexilliferae]